METTTKLIWQATSGTVTEITETENNSYGRHEMKSELLSCPFCGSVKDCIIFSDEGRLHGMCWACLCRTKDFDSKEEAVRAWNTRPNAEVKLDMNALDLAILFHREYEKLAPSFGYDTRKETQIFDPESPNGKLMVAVCEKMIEHIKHFIFIWPIVLGDVLRKHC